MASPYGDGSDGDVTISTDTTLTENKQYNNLTVNAGITLNTAGYTVKVKNTLINNGTITDSSSGGAGGAGGAVGSGGVNDANGGAGGNGNAGTGTGGTGGGGGGGGAGQWKNDNQGFCWHVLSTTGGNGGAGGVGGQGGGTVIIAAKTFTNNGTINANGVAGSAGSNGGNGQHDFCVCGGYPPDVDDIGSGAGGGGGGGNGGDGGTVSLTYESRTEGTVTAAGGAGGGAGNGGSGVNCESPSPGMGEYSGGIGGSAGGGAGGAGEEGDGSSGNGINGTAGSAGSAGTVTWTYEASGIQINLDDNFSIGDSLLTALIKRISQLESFGISDAISKNYIKKLAELFSVADSVEANKIIRKELLESITVNDTGEIKITVKSLGETVSITDDITKIFFKALSENVSIADVVTKSLIKAISEGINISDSITKIFIKALSENISILDAITKDFLKFLSEAVSIADVVETLRTAYVILSEVISITDSVTPSGRFHMSEPSDQFLNVESLKNNQPTFDIFLWIDGTKYDLTNRLISANVLNREMFHDPGRSQKLVIPDAKLVFENTDKYLSDNNPDSILYKKTYMGQPIEIWAGFELDDNVSELIIQANMKVKFIELDTTKATATIYCYDELKDTFDINVGMPLPDGTPNPLTYTNKTFKYIVEDLLINKAGIFSDRIDIENVGLTFANVSFEQKKVGWCLQKLGEIAAGSFFVETRIIFKSFQTLQQMPVTKKYKYDENFQNLHYTGQDIGHAIKKIIVIGKDNLYREKEIGDLGRDLTINNEYAESTSMTDRMIAAYQKRLAVVPAKVKIKGEYLPSYRVGTGVKVYELHSGMNPFNFHVVRMALDILKFVSTIELAKIDFERVAWGEAYWGETYWNIEKSQFRPLEQLEESIVITDSVTLQII